MSERHLDEAIDRAARAMTAADPRPGLSRRVLARLQARRTPWLSVPRATVAATVVTIAVAAMLVSRTPAPAPQELPAGRDLTLAVRDAPRVPPRHAASAAPLGAGPVTRGLRPRGHREPVDAIPPFAGGLHVTPLRDIVPITLDPAGPRALDAPEVVVAPLAAIEPLRVDPLSFTPH